MSPSAVTSYKNPPPHPQGTTQPVMGEGARGRGKRQGAEEEEKRHQPPTRGSPACACPFRANLHRPYVVAINARVIVRAEGSLKLARDSRGVFGGQGETYKLAMRISAFVPSPSSRRLPPPAGLKMTRTHYMGGTLYVRANIGRT